MKIVLLSLSSLLLSFSLTAQVWIDTGAVWHYDYWNLGEAGFDEYKYTQDTLIDGHLCQQIEGEHYRYWPSGAGVFIGSSTLETQYTYVSGDTVFYRTDDAFNVMLNFGAEVGDSWIISTEIFDVCNDTSIAIVTATGTVEIDGSVYRTITLQMESTSSFGFEGVFCERFGNMTLGDAPLHALFPKVVECDSLSEIGVYEWDFYNFKCFEDESFSLYNPSGITCDWWRVNIGLTENDVLSWEIFPNPTTGILNITNLIPGTAYVLYDLMGKQIKSGTIQSGVIDLNEFEAGINILQLNNQIKKVFLLD